MAVIPDEQVEGLWWLAAPVLVWTAHFGAAYALVSVGCAHLAAGTVELGLAAATALTLLALGWLAWRGWQGWREVADAPEPATPAARHRFISLATFLLSSLAAIGVLFEVAGIALVGGCP